MGATGLDAGQSLKEVYRLICTATRLRQPIAATYEGTQKRLCPYVDTTTPVSAECSATSTEAIAGVNLAWAGKEVCGAVCR